MQEPALGVGAFLLTDHADGPAAETPEAADDGGVLAEGPVARERREIGDEARHIVAEMRPLRVTCDLGLLPGRQIHVKFR